MVKLFFLAFGIFLAIDMVWLGVIAKDLYAQQIGHLMKTQINWYAAIIFYIIFVAGLVFFVINPALDKNDLRYALIAGAFFGLVSYATYDLTNLAVTKDWPVTITIIDLVWGMVLSTSVSGLTFILAQKLF